MANNQYTVGSVKERLLATVDIVSESGCCIWMASLNTDGHNKPLCVDLYCGLGGWTEGFLSEDWDVVGFDIERHQYGDQKYPAQLVLQDVLTLHGRQFRHADCIVASPPCQEYSYMAMPWSRGKQIATALRGQGEFPEGYTGSRTIPQLTALFDACFRIQREACDAAGHYIPMVVENVKGAQPWVGKAKANFGSFYFWGDVAMVGGCVVAGAPQFGRVAKAARRGLKRNPDGTEHPQGSWFTVADSKERGANGGKVDGFNFHQFEKTGEPGGSFQTAALKTTMIANIRDGYAHTRHLTNQAESDAIKHGGDCFNDPSWPGKAGGTKKHGSKSDSRKAASAQIAKIPFPLSSYVARMLKSRALPETP